MVFTRVGVTTAPLLGFSGFGRVARLWLTRACLSVGGGSRSLPLAEVCACLGIVVGSKGALWGSHSQVCDGFPAPSRL